MRVDEWLMQREIRLKRTGNETPRLDCVVLLEDVTAKNRAWLLAHPEHILSASDIKKLDDSIARRMAHEPLAYIRGKVEFYGREFYVDSRVLVSRPESETLIELLTLQLSHNKSVEYIVDIGTGSGCLAIIAQLIFPNLQVYATDIQPDTLKVARKNARTHQTEVKFYAGDLLRPVASKLSKNAYGIIANLPYVPLDYPVNKAATHEPAVALFAEDHGIQIYRRLFKQIMGTASRPYFLITESLPEQHVLLAKLAVQHNFQLKKTQGFAQLFTPIG